MRILKDLIPKIVRAYLNDIDIKGLRSRYNNEEILELPKVRRFILKHFQNMDYILINLECTSITISSKKSKFYITSIKIIGFVYNTNSRHLSIFKIVIIIKWLDSKNIIKVRAFIDIYVYYRI